MSRLRPAVVLAAVAAIAVVAPAHDADAKPKAKKKKPVGEKVRIETEPAGATVYVGDKDSGSAGVTPLDLSLAPGEQVVILELDGFVPRFETVVVEDLDDTTQTFAYELAPSTAVLMIEPEAGVTLPPGTTVMIDGVDQGELPARVEVEVGAHQVQVTAPGREPYEDWVEVDGGEEHVMTISAAALGGVVDTAPPKKKKRGPRAGQMMAELRAGVQIGFRRFRYSRPRSDTARPYDARGTAHFQIDLELYPWRRFVANKVLDRLSITAGAGYSPPIGGDDGMGTSFDAYWRSHNAGLRFHAPVIPRLAVDIDAGYQHTLYTFLDSTGAYVPQAPDVDYHSIRIGATVVGTIAPAKVWLGADNRVVVKGGALETRYHGSVDGVAVRAGASARFLDDHLEARLEGELARYGWTFDTNDGDEFDADGGRDYLYGVTISVGGAY